MEETKSLSVFACIPVINEVLIKNSSVIKSKIVTANNHFDFKLSPEIEHYLHNNISDFEQLSLLIKNTYIRCKK